MTDDRRTGGPAGERPPVGSVAEEAAELLAVLAAMARDQGSARADAAGSAAGSAAGAAAGFAADALRGVNEHLAAGSAERRPAECTWCPVCQVIHAVRTTSPEVKAHLAVAASSLMQAAAGLLATHVPTDHADRPVERIDLDADAGWDDQ